MEVGSKLEGSYAMALNIWIDRYRKAMATIREIEDEQPELLRQAFVAGQASQHVPHPFTFEDWHSQFSKQEDHSHGH